MAYFKLLAVLAILTINFTNALSQDHSVLSKANKHELKWITKNGFNIQKYNWEDEPINLHLKWALQKRKASASWLTAGAVLLTTTGILFSLNSVATALSDHSRGGVNASLFVGTGILFTAGTIIPSILKSRKGKKYVKHAEMLRKNNSR